MCFCITHLQHCCPPSDVCCPVPRLLGPSQCAVWSCPHRRMSVLRRHRFRIVAAAVERMMRWSRSRRCPRYLWTVVVADDAT